MIYTYEISLNGSDYVSLYPTNHPKITTERDGEEFIWRDKVDEFKINESLNETVYGLLETWYGDTTKYGLSIKIRVKKSGTIKWTFVFGIKQGKINYENKYYIIQPEILDQYTNLEFYKDRAVIHGATQKFYLYVNEDDAAANGVDEIYMTSQYRYQNWMDAVEAYLDVQTGDTWNIQSAFLWGDVYPDAGSYPTLPTLDTNFAIRKSADGAGYLSIDHLLNVPRQFECYYHVSSDYIIHLEHVGWYYEQIQDYQLDLTGSDYYDNSRIFNYSTPEFVSSEVFMPVDEGNILTDYSNAGVYYDPYLVGFGADKKEYRADYTAYLSSDFDDKFMAIGTLGLCIGWNTVSGWTNWVHTATSPNITNGDANGAGNTARTNFVAPVGLSVTITYDITFAYESGPANVIQMRGYLDSTAQGAGWTDLAAGSNTGSFTGNHIRFQSTGTQDFNFTISLTVANRYRIPWEDGEISDISRQNNYLAWANILNRFWQYNRYAQSGTLNGASSDFLSLKFLREQEEFKFYYASDIDPMRGIQTDYGIGMIQSMTRDLSSDWITIKLRYE